MDLGQLGSWWTSSFQQGALLQYVNVREEGGPLSQATKNSGWGVVKSQAQWREGRVFFPCVFCLTGIIRLTWSIHFWREVPHVLILELPLLLSFSAVANPHEHQGQQTGKEVWLLSPWKRDRGICSSGTGEPVKSATVQRLQTEYFTFDRTFCVWAGIWFFFLCKQVHSID